MLKRYGEELTGLKSTQTAIAMKVCRTVFCNLSTMDVQIWGEYLHIAGLLHFGTSRFSLLQILCFCCPRTVLARWCEAWTQRISKLPKTYFPETSMRQSWHVVIWTVNGQSGLTLCSRLCMSMNMMMMMMMINWSLLGASHRAKSTFIKV